MEFAIIFVVVLLVVALVFGVMLVGIFNKLVTYRNRYKNGFAQIEVQLKRRYDLIPNLVETAKGYMSHERETLEAVMTARNQAATGLKAAAADPGMGRLFAVAEQYPDLKANQNMMQLTEELTSTENKVAFPDRPSMTA